jgi:outer membrane protein
MKHWMPVLLVTLLTPGSLLAQKIAVINFDRVVAESADGRAAGVELQAYFDELSSNLQQQQTDLNELQEQLATQERVLSPTALAQLNRNIQAAQTRLTRDTEDADMEMQAKQDELLLPVFEKAQAVFEQYAQEQDFTMIFNAAAPQSGLVYAANSIDITNEIIRRMDAASQTNEATEPPQPAPQPDPEP